MARFLCFTLPTSKKKKSSKKSAISADVKQAKPNENPRVKPEELLFEILPSHNTVEKLMPNADVTVETAYKGGDDNNKKHSMKRDLSDLDLQSNQNNSTWSGLNHPNQTTPEIPTPSSHQSEPGMVQEMSKDSSSPRLLKRSCSNIERKSAAWTDSKVNKSRSYGNLASLPDGAVPNEKGTDSPFSVKTSCTADRVMLKKRSSSQVLPSRSRKLWWRLFMWSHRNLHRTNWISSIRAPARAESVISDISNNNKGGYTSDTLETSEIVDKKKKKVIEDPSNQWMAFSTETTYLDRVSAWVNSIPNKEDEICEDENEELLGDNMDGEFFLPSLPEVGESSGKNHSHANKRRGGDEDLQANNVIQSLNFLSSVAHISGMALKVVPAISAFTSLKAVNLSSNFIVHIPSGALPKSLHMLDLSRNKIVAIEGLRELTRLRVLNLSYNRISRIGQGLSSCTAIKELYLAGNKISDVEGLHRLLKLTVLDLSFNKITMTKAIGQLVANYNSLLALNLLGNPIQSNIGDEQLKKAVSGLLPKVAYLNKQLIKPQRGREVTTDRVAKAALGNTGWDSRRKVARRVSQISGPGSLSRGGRSVAEGNSHRGKSRHRK